MQAHPDMMKTHSDKGLLKGRAIRKSHRPSGYHKSYLDMHLRYLDVTKKKLFTHLDDFLDHPDVTHNLGQTHLDMRVHIRMSELLNEKDA